jgi:abequosyltransferase
VPRLSICIPTLNRAAFIGETLGSIFPQLTNEVEIIVVDGASTDQTEETVTQAFTGRPSCRYIRLSRNGGFDRDCCRAVEEASGDYCWLFTDDDVLVPGAVAAVLEALRDGPDMVLVNSEVRSKDLAVVLVGSRCRIDSDVNFPPGDLNELMAGTGDLLSFLGAVVIRRSVWLSRQSEPFYNSDFMHVGVIFQCPFERHCRFIAKPLVRIRYGNAHWVHRAFKIWAFGWPSLIWSFPSVSDDAKASVCAREPWKRTSMLLMSKVRGWYTTKVYDELLAAQPMSFYRRIVSFCIAWFPDRSFNWIVRALAKVLVPRSKRVSLLFELDHSPYSSRNSGAESRKTAI